MTEDEALHVELVRAIELEDRESSLLTPEDRAQAETHARGASAAVKGRRSADAFIVARADFASARLATRHPRIAALLRRSRWPRWIGVTLPLFALIAGFVANEFGTGKRLDLLAVPLLGTIVWNLVVYGWLLLALIGRRGGPAGDPLYRGLLRVRGFGRGNAEHGTALQRAGAAFERRWASSSAPLTGARIERTMHLSAALFACGLIGGIYLRALVIEYRAGWESTFLGPHAVQALLSTVLGPASAVTGVSIPSTAGIAAMRWTGPDTGGVNAGPWILLYTATVVGLVILPRLLLAAWQGGQALRLAHRFPVAGREDFYIRRLLRTVAGTPATVRITPYAYRPGDETRRRLSQALSGALGDDTEVRFDQPIDYGEEDGWLARNVSSHEQDYQILLFTLSATPEEENHGALAAALAGRTASAKSGTMVAAIVDETPYRAHFAGQAGLDERVAGRMGEWRKTLAAARIVPFGLDLSQDFDRELAQRLESGLIPDGAMRG